MSAFADTQGGWIMLGVTEGAGRFAVDGVTNPAAPVTGKRTPKCLRQSRACHKVTHLLYHLLNLGLAKYADCLLHLRLDEMLDQTKYASRDVEI